MAHPKKERQLKRNPQQLRRGEHRPCVSLRRTICEKTREIDRLNIVRSRLTEQVPNLRRTLRDLGWSIEQLDRLAALPDTGAALDEIERNRRRRDANRRLIDALRPVRRSPELGADLAIEAVRQTARRQASDLRQIERQTALNLQAAERQLDQIPAQIRNAEALLSEAGARAKTELCDPDYVNQWCPSRLG